MRNWINLINEASVPDTLDRKAVASAVYENIEWDGVTGSTCKLDYMRDRDIPMEGDPDDVFHDPLEVASEKVDHRTDDFKHWFGEWVEENYGEIEWDILSRVNDHHIMLWRCITAPNDWTPEGRHPGIFWSYIKGAEEAHWGDFRSDWVHWVMEAKVPVDAIDWLGTLTMAGQPAYQEEREVRLLADYPIEVARYWRKR